MCQLPWRRPAPLTSSLSLRLAASSGAWMLHSDLIVERCNAEFLHIANATKLRAQTTVSEHSMTKQ